MARDRKEAAMVKAGRQLLTADSERLMWMGHDARRLEALAKLAAEYDALPRLREQAEREGMSWERLIPADHVIFAPVTSDYLLIADRLPPRLGPWVFPSRIAAAMEWDRKYKWPSMEQTRRRFRRAAKKFTRPAMLRRLMAFMGLGRRTRGSDPEV